MARVAIGLGSNLGDRSAHLAAARSSLAVIGREIAASSLYETAPVGPVEQGPYLNSVIVLETETSPDRLLQGLLDIERARGRVRDLRWGPRTLDLDLLLYGDQVVERPGLTVPHPEMTNRRFVLEPLLEAWPEAVKRFSRAFCPGQYSRAIASPRARLVGAAVDCPETIGRQKAVGRGLIPRGRRPKAVS